MEYEVFDIKNSLHVEIFNKSGPRIKMLILLILPFPMYNKKSQFFAYCFLSVKKFCRIFNKAMSRAHGRNLAINKSSHKQSKVIDRSVNNSQ